MENKKYISKNMRRSNVFLVLLMLAVSIVRLNAQGQTLQAKPVTTTEGYEFFVTWLPNGDSRPKDKDLTLQLLVSSRPVEGHPEITENQVRVEMANNTYKDYTVKVGTTEIIEVDAQNVYWDAEKGEEEKLIDKGVRVYSKNNVPMTVYSTNQNGGISGDGATFALDGAHVLPKQALGYEYVVQTASFDRIATEFVIMSTKSGRTNVKLSLTTNSRKTNKQELNFTFTKAKQIYIVRSQSPTTDEGSEETMMDLSGSLICADAPVAVWCGNQLAHIPTNEKNISQDYAVDQLLPISRWQNEFVVPLTGLLTRWNEVHVISLEDDNKVDIYGNKNKTTPMSKTLNSREKWVREVKGQVLGNVLDSTLYIKAAKPIQVYLYSTSGVVNLAVTPDGREVRQGNPAMTMISPLAYMTDTMVFPIFEGGDKTMEHQATIWAKKSTVSSIQLDGVSISAQFKDVPTVSGYSLARVNLTPGAHTLTAAEKGFGGYILGMSVGQAYMYPIGYEYRPKLDSLFLNDPNQEYPVFRSEWDKSYLNRGGWYLDREELPGGKVILDSIRVCDSTELTFPIKMYNEWDHVKWEIIGSIQKTNYFTPLTQYATETDKPELTHEFHLLPKSKNKKPFEDFAVRAVVYHKPILCDDGNPEKWPKDTLNTTVRVFREYNDTTWRVVCNGKTTTFFKDTNAEGKTYQTVFNSSEDDRDNGKYKYDLGENIITRHYVSVGGCDSLSTLRLFVCPTYSETKQMTVCADELGSVSTELGDFFSNVDFPSSYAAKGSGWKKQPSGNWLYKGKSTLKTEGCWSEIGEYLAHGVKYQGCDSVMNLELLVVPMEEIHTSQVVCSDEYTWKNERGETLEVIRSNGVEMNKPIYRSIGVPYKKCIDCPPGGCDSVRYTLELTFVSREGITHEVHVCQNESHASWTYTDNSGSKTWQFSTEGKTCGRYSQPVESFTSIDGCKYNYTVVFVVDSVYDIREDSVLYCYEEGFSVEHKWNGHANYKVYYPDGSVSENMNSVRINETGIYTLVHEMKTIRGCDSIRTQVVVVRPSYIMPMTEYNMADDEYFQWGNIIIAGNKATNIFNPNGLKIERYPLGVDTLKQNPGTTPINGQSCDSIISMILRVGTSFRDTTYDAICSNCGEYQWKVYNPSTGNMETLKTIYDLPKPGESKEYFDSLQTTSPVKGLDSIYVLYLAGYPNYEITESMTICQGEEFIWNGHMSDNNGIAHNLYFNGMPTTIIPTEKPGIFTVRDEMLTHEVIYTNPKTGEQKKIQCDSVHILTLNVCKTYNHQYNTEEVTDFVGMKSNELLPYFNDRWLFVGSDYDWSQSPYTEEELRAQYDTLIKLSNEELWIDSIRGVSQCGCDSMHYVNIHMCKLKLTTITKSIGDNDTTWYFGGDELDIHGNPIHTQPLITGEKFHYYDDGTPVDYSMGKDPTVREYQFVDTILTKEGCDSIIYATVWVYPTYRMVEQDVTCANQRYDWRGQQNLNELINQTTDPNKTVFDVYDNLKTVKGFDSVYVLQLSIIPSLLIKDTVHACYNEKVDFYDQLIPYTGSEMVDVVAIFKDENAPCGREHRRRIIFEPAYGYNGDKDSLKWIDTAFVCQYEPFEWIDRNGNKHTKSLYDSKGNRLKSVPTDSAGWITIYDKLKTVACDCDSIHTLHLYVDPAYRYVTDTAVCVGTIVEWHDMEGNFIKTYVAEQAGDVYDTIPYVKVNGCDSSFYFHMHVDPIYEIHDSIVLCADVDSHFEWNGVIYDDTISQSIEWDEPQEFFDTIWTTTILSGCDSTMYLHLTIVPRKDSLLRDTICVGEKYYFFGKELIESGEYKYDQPNEWGCITHNLLKLDVLLPTEFVITPEPVCVDEDGLANTYLIHYAYQGTFGPITYNIHYDSIAQALGFVSRENIPIPTDPNSMQEGQEYTLVLPVPEYANKQDYPRPGYYQAELSFDNGVCSSDSLMTFPFEMVMRYPSWITQQHWNDAILIMDSTQNGGYVFSAYQWYRNGEILYGQTRPYLFEPEWLEDGAEYTVELTREDDNVTVMTCPLIPDLSGDYGNSPTQTYISVVPTIVAKESPIVYILSPTNGSYKLYNSQGQLVTQGDYVPNEYNAGQVVLPSVSGVYVFHLVENTTMGTGNDLRRTVKVIVQ